MVVHYCDGGWGGAEGGDDGFDGLGGVEVVGVGHAVGDDGGCVYCFLIGGVCVYKCVYIVILPCVVMPMAVCVYECVCVCISTDIE